MDTRPPWMKPVGVAVAAISVLVLGLGVAALLGAIEGPGWTYVVLGIIGSAGIPLAIWRAGRGARSPATKPTPRKLRRMVVISIALGLVVAVAAGVHFVRGDIGGGIALVIGLAGLAILAVGGAREFQQGRGSDDLG